MLFGTVADFQNAISEQEMILKAKHCEVEVKALFPQKVFHFSQIFLSEGDSKEHRHNKEPGRKEETIQLCASYRTKQINVCRLEFEFKGENCSSLLYCSIL